MRRLKREDVKREDVKPWRGAVIAVALLFTFHVSRFTPLASAAPTQEDVFKSIQTNVGESGAADSGKVLALLAGVAAVVILLVLFNQRQRREAAPKVLNHPGKLLKEVMRDTGLRPVEVKQLKILAEETRVAEGEALQSPLTLLLCPSVLAKAVHARPAKIDRRVVAQVLRKLGAANNP